MRGTQIGMARHGDSAFEIVRVLVIGIETDGGIRPVPSRRVFLALRCQRIRGLSEVSAAPIIPAKGVRHRTLK